MQLTVLALRVNEKQRLKMQKEKNVKKCYNNFQDIFFYNFSV